MIASIESQLGGQAEFDWRPEGLVCCLSVPLPQRQFAADPVSLLETPPTAMACDAPSGNPALEGSAAMKQTMPDALSRRRCDGIGRLPARSLRRFDRAHQIRRTKWLLQADDVGELRRFGQKVQRGHS